MTTNPAYEITDALYPKSDAPCATCGHAEHLHLHASLLFQPAFIQNRYRAEFKEQPCRFPGVAERPEDISATRCPCRLFVADMAG